MFIEGPWWLFIYLFFLLDCVVCFVVGVCVHVRFADSVTHSLEVAGLLPGEPGEVTSLQPTQA